MKRMILNRMIISLLLQSSSYGLLLTGCPLTMMAMESIGTKRSLELNADDAQEQDAKITNVDEDDYNTRIWPTIYLQSRLHYRELDFATNEQIPETIVCSPSMRYFGHYIYTQEQNEQGFDHSFDRLDGTDSIESLISYLSYNRFYHCNYYNKHDYPYYRVLAAVLKITKSTLRYDCKVEKYLPGEHFDICKIKNYTVDIPLPTTYNTSTQCTLLFSNLDKDPYPIFPHLMTAEQKKSLLAELKPQYWINIKATYEPDFKKRKFEFAEPKHMPHDTDLE